jgi:rhodanese-related sulfurtransferase
LHRLFISHILKTEVVKMIQPLHKKYLLTVILNITLGFGFVAIVNSQVTKSELPKDKQTTLGLYVTAKEAYDKWKADPEKVMILDVRTPEEYLFIGHPDMAWNIPLLFQSYEWDQEKQRFPMKPNPDFISLVKQIAGSDNILLVTCRSGGRSAKAVNKLAEAGFINVYNITDGIEGDLVTSPESVFKGQRLINGWKNSGLPWTYDIVPEKMLISGQR